MSNSTECWDFSAQRLPEKKKKKKQSFSQTCSRFSRYLKENGSFGDLSFEMTCKPEIVNVYGSISAGGFVASSQPTVMNLFPCEALGTDSSVAQDVILKDLFPRESSFASSSSSVTKEEAERIVETNSVKPESQSAPLTIFYGGQVFVFDDFPAKKAKEVIDLAKKGGSAKSFTGFTAEVNQTSNTNLALSPPKTAAQETMQPIPSSLTCELPIARKASLYRFLEKRKDRISSKSPYYQIDWSTKIYSDSDCSWLGTV